MKVRVDWPTTCLGFIFVFPKSNYSLDANITYLNRSIHAALVVPVRRTMSHFFLI